MCSDIPRRAGGLTHGHRLLPSYGGAGKTSVSIARLMASGAPLPTVAVAVRPGGSASRRAARWAAASLLQDDGAGRAAAIAFVHVIPQLTFVPSPSKDAFPLIAFPPVDLARADARGLC